MTTQCPKCNKIFIGDKPCPNCNWNGGLWKPRTVSDLDQIEEEHTRERFHPKIDLESH